MPRTDTLEQAYFAALLEADPAAATSALRRAAHTHDTLADAIHATVTPAMRSLDRLRGHGELSDSDLHAAAAVSHTALASLPSRAPRARARAVVATLDGHDLGAQCVAVALRADGWTVELLRAPAPAALLQYVELARPGLVALSVARIDLLADARQLARDLDGLEDPPFVRLGGGAVASQPKPPACGRKLPIVSAYEHRSSS